MILMTSSDLTAHALTEAEWMARGKRYDYTGCVDLTLTVHPSRLPIAIPLVWALFRNMRVETDDSLGHKWMVRCIAHNKMGNVVNDKIVLNDGC